MRPSVYGNAPPPCAKHNFKFGCRSSTPPNASAQMAREVSAGMPTSHGIQKRGISSRPTTSHGCTKIAAPSSSAAAKKSANAALSRSTPFTLVPICAPGKPSCFTQRSSSRTASVASCIGTVASAMNRSGIARTTPAKWSLSNCDKSCALAALAPYENITGTVERTCMSTPLASHSCTRRAASQQFDSISRNNFPSIIMRALQ